MGKHLWLRIFLIFSQRKEKRMRENSVGREFLLCNDYVNGTYECSEICWYFVMVQHWFNTHTPTIFSSNMAQLAAVVICSRQLANLLEIDLDCTSYSKPCIVPHSLAYRSYFQMTLQLLSAAGLLLLPFADKNTFKYIYCGIAIARITCKVEPMWKRFELNSIFILKMWISSHSLHVFRTVNSLRIECVLYLFGS